MGPCRGALTNRVPEPVRICLRRPAARPGRGRPAGALGVDEHDARQLARGPARPFRQWDDVDLAHTPTWKLLKLAQFEPARRWTIANSAFPSPAING